MVFTFPMAPPFPISVSSTPHEALKKRPALMADLTAGPAPAPYLFFFHPVSRYVFFCVRPGSFVALSVSYLCLLVGSCLLVGWSSLIISCI
ncbi:hypothetical protein B5M44_04385 [Shinella sumterensis]|nr:hypothetical protein B5M44_04385 [Shinella sumterensis]